MLQPSFPDVATAVDGRSAPPPPNFVRIPERLQREMKENISPEHTITAASVRSVKSQPLPDDETARPSTSLPSPALALIPDAVDVVEKVQFSLGGDDDDDDDTEEDEDGRAIDVNDTDDNDANDGIQPTSASAPRTQATAATDRPSSGGSATPIGADVVAPATVRLSAVPGLGQITRDSLSILHGSASTASYSRDSIRSLESLDESDPDA